MEDKVSVVVPVYNVEKYLHQCVQSILKQTYENLEVILVDDGSTDQGSNIVDQYAELDKRVRVIHKENGGLSDARNYGIKEVTGTYILFVDSDDWLDPHMIENMVTISLEYNADIVQSSFYYAYEDYLLYDNRFYTKEQPPILLDRKSLMSELVVNERVKNFAWGKLYKTDLIIEIPFKKGVLFEDVFWAHQVMHEVNRYVMIHKPLYYYRQREDSIVAHYSPKNLDIIKGLKERHSFIERNYKELISESHKILLKTCLTHYHLLLQNREEDQKGLLRKGIYHYIKDNYDSFINAVKDESSLKNQLILFCIHPYLNVSFLFLEKLMRKLRLTEQPLSLEKIHNHKGAV